MLRLFLKLSLIFIFSFTTLSIAARVLGTTQLSNPALAGFTKGCEGKPQPCWFGIVPGVTTAKEVRQILATLGYTSEAGFITEPSIQMLETKLPHNGVCEGLFTFSNRADVIASFTLHLCSDLRLGDVMAKWGSPALSYDCLTLEIYRLGQPVPIVFYPGLFTLNPWPPSFEDDLRLQPEIKIDLNYPVREIAVGNPDVHAEQIVAWRGFAPYWRYKQLEPEDTKKFCS